MGRVVASHLGKAYRRHASKRAKLMHMLLRRADSDARLHWVLRDLSFEVAPGQSVGIVGQNGAGKSTLLKILTGTTRPTEGTLACTGRLAAILELGMGFHPDFTGRQNAVMGCQMLGLAHEHIKELVPQIIRFSELDDYADEPFRTYSSGMQIRLAFSVATAVRPDILIIDEALSVGDAYFQQKSANRIKSFKAQGTTLLFVSHDGAAVKQLCDRALLLDKGTLVRDGAPSTVLDYYNAIIARDARTDEIKQVESASAATQTRSGNGMARLDAVEMLTEDGRDARAFRIGEVAVIRCVVHYFRDVDNPTIGILIRDRLGSDIFGTNTHHLGGGPSQAKAGELVEFCFRVTLNLGIGTYSLTVAAHTGETHLDENLDWWNNVVAFQMLPHQGFKFIGAAALPASVVVSPLADSTSAPGNARSSVRGKRF